MPGSVQAQPELVTIFSANPQRSSFRHVKVRSRLQLQPTAYRKQSLFRSLPQTTQVWRYGVKIEKLTDSPVSPFWKTSSCDSWCSRPGTRSPKSPRPDFFLSYTLRHEGRRQGTSKFPGSNPPLFNVQASRLTSSQDPRLTTWLKVRLTWVILSLMGAYGLVDSKSMGLTN
ncbi:hypothetical protein BJV77DRAFT_516870 [Russula vinacea]|nr:hypothetical protein BJV77DRAFT_516870 [Russula vinacea]